MIVYNQIGRLRFQSFKLCLVLEKFEGKKIERKSRRNKKVKENKNRFKFNKLFLYDSFLWVTANCIKTSKGPHQTTHGA